MVNPLVAMVSMVKGNYRELERDNNNDGKWVNE